jgi:hypothetical protein
MEKKNIGFDTSIRFGKTSKGKIYWSDIMVSPINFDEMEKAIKEANILEDKYNWLEENKKDGGDTTTSGK